MSLSTGSGVVGCGQTSATWLPLTMPLPPSTGPSESRERRSSAFVREDSGIAQRPRRILSIPSRVVLEHRRAQAPRVGGPSGAERRAYFFNQSVAYCFLQLQLCIVRDILRTTFIGSSIACVRLIGDAAPVRHYVSH